jgi:N-acetylmuramoyl-L-alanine amidase
MNRKQYILVCMLFSGVVSLFLLHAHIAYAFSETLSPESLRIRYASPVASKIKILVVPGHDDDVWGTQFKDVKEGVMNAVLAEDLYNFLLKDPRFDVVIARTKDGGYNPIIWDYIDLHRTEIADFISSHRQAMSTALQTGTVQPMVAVPHNEVKQETGTRLYGINKWANENNVDLVINIHFDDYGGRPWNAAGKYQGLTVYIPDHQYGNARVSAAIGQALFSQLTNYYPKSTFPPEAEGLVEDQDLIATGASNTLNAASVLTEYGYIYESQFLNETIRNKVLKDLAYQTSIGIESFFGNQIKYQNKFKTALLPFTWSKGIKFGISGSVDILALQAALRKEGMYPPVSMTQYSCPVAGSFGPCTQAALKTFQKKYGISPTGFLGPITRAKLNSLYSK